MPHQVGASRYVFVYGTLRAGGSNDIARYRPAPERVGHGVIAGTLYDLGAYPGAVLGGCGQLVGEIYRIGREVEVELDRLEGVAPEGDGEYLKREVDVVVNGVALRCLVYEIAAPRIAGRPLIGSGDWMRRS